MELILRRIPEGTQLEDIGKFIAPALKGGWLNKPGSIVSIRIITLREIRTSAIEHHGIIHIQPDDAALRVVKALKKEIFKGKQSGLKEYVQRNWHNDRRQMHTQTSKQFHKRQGERRRGMEVIANSSWNNVG